MADPDAEPDPSSQRPSFSSFWKRSKEAVTGRKITFVPSTSSQPATNPPTGSDGEPSQSTKDKAQIRRAQVRKAQIQHRQRKANYVKQLERDVAEIRDLIATAEGDRKALRTENDSIRVRLSGSGTAAQDVAVFPPINLPSLPLPDPMFGDIDLDDLTVNLEMDKLMETPIYQITNTTSGSNGFPSQHASPQSQAAPSSVGLPEMTPEQTQQAINFILALEHICWNHFEHADFVHTAAADVSGVESGHTMMASSLALRTAPPEVFTSIEQATENLTKRGRSQKAGEDPIPPDLSWQASGLTLLSLYGLANSLNPSDKELTPVQAWFELASRYPMALLLRQDILEALKVAFVGVVKCPHYGAEIERSAYESIVHRILGPELVAGYSPVAGSSGQAA